MSRQTTFLMTVFEWLRDPVVRQRAAMRRAERRGMARMMDPMVRALEEADEILFLLYGNRFLQYKQSIASILPLCMDQLPSSDAAPSTQLVPPLSPSTTTSLLPTYIITSTTLAQAFAHLTQHVPNTLQQPEFMLAVTGIKEGNLRTLEQLIDIPLATQSAATASFDMAAFGKVAITLHEQGQELHAIFHSHPTAGQPSPSGTDWQLQDTLDRGQYPAIQAVFSRDGYIRFFARQPFRLTVTGKGVDCVDPKSFLYQLVHYGTLPRPGNSVAPKRDKAALRPVSAHSGR